MSEAIYCSSCRFCLTHHHKPRSPKQQLLMLVASVGQEFGKAQQAGLCVRAARASAGKT